MTSLRSTVFAVGIAIAAGWSCGGGSSSPPTNPSPTNFTILINGERGEQSFAPNPAAVGGRMVVFRNNDTVAHRVRLNDLSVDWGTIAPGATSPAFRMPAVGTNYHCDLHPGMIGAVNPEAGGDPPRCTGEYC
jgi:plastocyanin